MVGIHNYKEVETFKLGGFIRLVGTCERCGKKAYLL